MKGFDLKKYKEKSSEEKQDIKIYLYDRINDESVLRIVTLLIDNKKREVIVINGAINEIAVYMYNKSTKETYDIEGYRDISIAHDRKLKLKKLNER